MGRSVRCVVSGYPDSRAGRVAIRLRQAREGKPTRAEWTLCALLLLGDTVVAFVVVVCTQDMIADVAGMKSVEWDGYMKYWAPSKRFIQARQAAFAANLDPLAPDESADVVSELAGRRPGKPRRVRRRHTAQT